MALQKVENHLDAKTRPFAAFIVKPSKRSNHPGSANHLEAPHSVHTKNLIQLE